MDELSDCDDDIPFGSVYDPHGEAWFADLLFWRPSRLSDKQMQLHFSEWDGRWSDQTLRALQRFEAKGLDLNENWALCPPYWSCPACWRSKDTIFRLSKRGILLAKLELHHDHLRDWMWHHSRELFGDDWLDKIPRSSIIIIDYVRELTSRFDLCLLCSECNAADGKAKSWSRAAIDPKFSFTAQEIGRFVRARGGQDHDIDYEKALNIWEAERSNFLARLALIDELLAHLVSGRLARDYQGKSDARGVCSAFDPLTLLAQSFYHETKDTERAVLLEDFRQEFLARSTQRDSAKLLPSIEYKRAVAPTDEEYTAYVDPVSGKSWQAIPEDWTCPVCERGKRQILRKSKAGKWTGGVRSHYEYALETDPTVIAKRRRLFPNYRNDIFVKKIATLSLCSDCTGIGTALSQRDQSIRFPYLGMADYRACIISSQPHAPHEIDFETASRCAIANDSYRPAEAAFTAFRSKVKDFADRFERGRKGGIAKKVLLERLAEDIHVFHEIDSALECMDLTKWILEQYKTFNVDVPAMRDARD